MITDIIATIIHAQFEGVIAASDGEVVHQARLRDIATLREEEALTIPTLITRADSEVGHRAVAERQVAREKPQSLSGIEVAKKRRVIQHGTNEVVYDGRAEYVRIIQLAFILRLDAIRIKKWINGVGIRRLHATIELRATKNLIFVAEGIVKPARN